MTSKQAFALRPLSDSQREIAETATTRYQDQFSVEAYDHLAARGIELEAAQAARLGQVSDPEPGHEAFAGRLAIPYLDRNGQALTLRFRCLKGHDHKAPEVRCPKYMSISGDTPRLYNVRAVHQATDEIHIAEGELDAIVLEQLGLHAVALPGADAWKSHYRRIFDGFNQVLVWADPDEAGGKLRQTILNSVYQARPVNLTVGDVGETLLQLGAEALERALEEARPRREAA